MHTLKLAIISSTIKDFLSAIGEIVEAIGVFNAVTGAISFVVIFIFLFVSDDKDKDY